MSEKLPFFMPCKDGVMGRGAGTVNADGEITHLEPPIAAGYTRIRYFLPDDAIRAGSEAGWYVVDLSSPTAGRIDLRVPPVLTMPDTPPGGEEDNAAETERKRGPCHCFEHCEDDDEGIPRRTSCRKTK